MGPYSGHRHNSPHEMVAVALISDSLALTTDGMPGHRRPTCSGGTAKPCAARFAVFLGGGWSQISRASTGPPHALSHEWRGPHHPPYGSQPRALARSAGFAEGLVSFPVPSNQQ